MPQVQNPQPQTEVKPIDFGKGTFSSNMKFMFDESQKLFGLTPEKAEKLARQFGSDLGAAHNVLQFKLKFGAPNKDMLRALSMSAKTTRYGYPPSLQVAVAIDYASEAGKSYVSYGYTKWSFIPLLVEWIEKL